MLETSTSLGRASPLTRAAVCTAIPATFSPSHNAVALRVPDVDEAK